MPGVLRLEPIKIVCAGTPKVGNHPVSLIRRNHGQHQRLQQALNTVSGEVNRAGGALGAVQ